MPPYPVENGDSRGRSQVGMAVAFLAVALLLRAMIPDAQQEVAGALRSTVLRPFLLVQEATARARARALDVEALRAELDSLVTVTLGQRTLAEENRRLRGLLELMDRGGPAFRAATVLRPGTAGAQSLFMVDLGTRDGVGPGSPVVTWEGLAGVILDAGRNSSVGIDWTHPDFRAHAMTVDGEVYGIVEPWRGRFREEDRLLLNGTAFTERVEPGTLIVTSGLGGMYPRGIPIGRVHSEAEAEAGWRRSYWLLPAVAPGSVTHAQVMIRSREDDWGEVGEWWAVPRGDTLPGLPAEPPGGGAG